MSEVGHSRPGRASSKSGHVRYVTQVLPFADPRVLGLYGKFESSLYKALS
jgi:hypothetical protein